MLKVIPLGGLGAIGKNMTIIEYDDQFLVVDAGLMFPDEDMLGVDLVLPDFSYVVERADHALGVFLTHGHEDHIGALPYLLKQVDMPVFGSRLTLGLLNGKLGEHGLQGKADLREVGPEKTVEVGPFQVEFMEVCHSIPDGLGLAIHTPEGTVVHTGDFKLDQTPVDHRLTALNRFAGLGRDGVLLLMSDSTNAEVPGMTPTEISVGKTFETVFATAPGRIIVACFSSHLHRVQQVLDAAARHGRKVAVVGRSMTKNVNIAANLGYLTIPEGVLIRPAQVTDLPDEQVVIISTGSQGEPMSALARMAAGDHHVVHIKAPDTVVISARAVPGNERSVHRTVNRLFAEGATVIWGSEAQVHVSGHGAAEELKMMLNIVHPRFFMPVHGEIRHQHFHARLARECGMKEEDIFILENGDVLGLADGEAWVADRIPAGMIFVDGMAMRGIGDVVLRDRTHLSQDGLVMAVVTVRAQDGSLVGVPDLLFRGFVHSGDEEELAAQAQSELIDALHSDELQHNTDTTVLKLHIHDFLRRYLYRKTRRRPLVLPVVVEV
ncbi:MAG: ribonuclease J [Gaiellales bacterium]|nr:ribonuclease J [Gaiellales bacterium]